MQRRIGRLRWCRLEVLLFSALALVLGLAPALAGNEISGGDSPQAVFEAAQAAAGKKDTAALVRLTAPSERAMMAFNSDLGVSMMVEFWEGESAATVKERYEDIRAKYGLKPESEDEGERLEVTSETPQEVIEEHIRRRAERLYGKIDTEGYVSEIMAIVLEMPEMADGLPFPEGELLDVRIDGDKATGSAGDKKIAFMSEGGRWYLTADAVN